MYMSSLEGILIDANFITLKKKKSFILYVYMHTAF